MSVPSLIRRSFGIIDDAVVGGTTLSKLEETAGSTAAAAGTIPTPTSMYAVTGGTIEAGLERIDRKNEVRGRRAVSPMLPFRAAPVVTTPFPAYRALVEKLLRKALGGADEVSGSPEAGYLHKFEPIGFSTGGVPSRLPAFHAQMIRDDLNHMLAGCVANKVSLAFPLDGEGTGELEGHALYYGDSQLPAPTPTFAEQENVLMLRDAQVVFDSGPTALTAPAKPTLTGHTTGGILPAATYNYQVVAYNSNGDTTGSGLATTAVTTTGSTGSVTVEWTAVTGALGYRVFGRTAGSSLLIADVGNNLSFVDTGSITPGGALPSANGTGGAVPDLTAFDFGFINNAIAKWYAGRNVGLMTSGTGALARTARLWFPTEFKIGGEQDVTFGLTFGNTNTAQEFNREYSTIQKLIFNVVGAAIAGTSPTAYESLQIVLHNAQPGTAGGADALAARGDETFRVEGNGFYSVSAGKDVTVEVLNGLSAALT